MIDGELIVKIVKANNLPSIKGDRIDAFIQVNVNKEMLQSQCIDDNENPVFNKELRFRLDNYNVNDGVHFKVMDKDIMSDDFIGEVRCNILNAISHPGSAVPFSLELVCANKHPSLQSILHVECTFIQEVQALGDLMINIIRASGMKEGDSFSANDCYVVVKFNDELEVTRTTVIEDKNNPVFNHAYVWELLYKSVTKQELTFQVYDKDDVDADDLLGLYSCSVKDCVYKWKGEQLDAPLHNKDGTVAKGSLKLSIKFVRK